MASNELLVKREGGLVVAALNRPEKLNALNKDLYEHLKTLVDLLETDKTARVMILTGAGEKAFSVGADLKERQGMNEKDILYRFEFVRQLFLRLERLPIPVIAALNGITLGGGLELALACDLRIASENAVLAFPEVELGIIPGTGGTQRLPRLIGTARAMELILTARRLTAVEAFQYGLVNALVPDGQSAATAHAWANKLCEVGPLAVRQAKYAIREGSTKLLEDGLRLETEAYKVCLRSKDRLEGLKAFSEKRKPIFQGQ